MLRGDRTTDQRCDDALHRHPARTLHEHGRARARVRCDVHRERLARCEGDDAPAPSDAAASAATCRVRTGARCRLHAHLCRPRDGGGSLRADLEHVAEHETRGPRPPPELVDGRAHRIGIGVVGVVDQRGAARRGERCEPFRTGRNVSSAGATAASGTPNATAAVDAASELEALWRPARRAMVTSPAGVAARERLAVPGVQRPRTTAGSRCEFDGPYDPRVRAPRSAGIDVRIVGIDDRDALLRQRADQLGLFGRDLVYDPHELVVGPLRVGDDRDLGARSRRAARSRRDDWSRARPRRRDARPGCEQRQRKADVVVEGLLRGDSSRRRDASAACSSSLVVVLPLLPVIAARRAGSAARGSGRARRARDACRGRGPGSSRRPRGNRRARACAAARPAPRRRRHARRPSGSRGRRTARP